MSIRVKLILTYAILLIVSASVLIFSGIAILSYVAVETTRTVLEESQFEVVVTEAIDLLAELKQAQDYEPEKLISPSYIEELSNNTDFFSGGIIVRYDKEVFNYNELPKSNEFYEQLKNPVKKSGKKIGKKTDREMGHGNNVVEYGDQTFFFIDYTFDVNGEKVIYYFIADITHTGGMGSESGKFFLYTILILLLIIMSPLLFILTNDIIKPIRKLETGVSHIKDGNLQFKLETKKKNELGRVIKYFDVMREELKKSIDKQVQFEENRKELISSISHDLKTPITSIKGHIEGIRDGVANTPEKMDKYLKVIYQKSQDMDQLIDDLFLFSKLDLNKLPFEMKEIMVCPFITEIITEMRLGWEDETQQILLDFSSDKMEQMSLVIDPQQIKRVLVNIIQNSMKYMDKENKTLKVTVNDSEDYVQVVIADNGLGIDSDHLKHIFDKFYRVDESRNPETGGTGLGLAIAKQIVEQHEGNISASSIVGEGTKIIIELKKPISESLEKEKIDV